MRIDDKTICNFFLILLFLIIVKQAFAQKEGFTSQYKPPNNKALYEYKKDENIQVYFFPVDNARWNGYEVTCQDWGNLDEAQKIMFIKEGIKETERIHRVEVELYEAQELLLPITQLAQIFTLGGKEKTPVIDSLYAFIKEKGLIRSSFLEKNIPSEAESYNTQGITYGMQSKSTTAIYYFNKAIDLNPSYAEAYCNRGIAYYDLGNLEQAISDCSKAIELRPTSSEAFYTRGIAYQGKKEFEKAIHDFSKAIEINPQDYASLVNRGYSHGILGNVEFATSDFNKAIEMKPERGEGYANRALIYFYNKEYDKCWVDVHKAKSLGVETNPLILQELKRISRREG